jgi:hypothetical protein
MADLRQDQGQGSATNAQRRQDWFSQVLGDSWEPVGDGTYRFVGEQAQAPAPDPLEPSSSESLIEDLAPRSAGGADATGQATSDADRSSPRRGLWRRR